MSKRKVSKPAFRSVEELQISDLDASEFVPVAIPASRQQAECIRASLETSDIPALMESEFTVGADIGAGEPILVPECCLERASRIVGLIELSGIDDDDELDEFDDDDDEDEEDEDEEDESDDSDEDELDEDDEFDDDDDEDDDLDDDDNDVFFAD